MWWLGYNMSVAVAVGFIALAGVAAETGVGLRSGGESNGGNRPDGERVTVPEDAISIRPDRPTKSSSI
jgi:hypothetical protein